MKNGRYGPYVTHEGTNATLPAEIKDAAAGWDAAALAAALEYEQAHAKRKGAIAELKSASAEGDG